jgi:hypothetical protein
MEKSMTFLKVNSPDSARIRRQSLTAGAFLVPKLRVEAAAYGTTGEGKGQL